MNAAPQKTARPVVLELLIALASVDRITIMAARRGVRPGHVSIVADTAVDAAAGPGRQGSPGGPPMTLADASRHVSIEMYSAAWCGACRTAKAWMHDQGITFHEVDVDQRQGALAQLQMLNPQRTLPTFDVDGRVIVGFEEPQLRSAIQQGAQRPR